MTALLRVITKTKVLVFVCFDSFGIVLLMEIVLRAFCKLLGDFLATSAFFVSSNFLHSEQFLVLLINSKKSEQLIVLKLVKNLYKINIDAQPLLMHFFLL